MNMEPKVQHVRHAQCYDEVLSSSAQRCLWEVVKDQQINGLNFIRQVLIEPFIVDFACVERKVIVELDDGRLSQMQYFVSSRTQYLKKRGFIVVRFYNNEVLTNMSTVLSTLRTQLPS